MEGLCKSGLQELKTLLGHKVAHQFCKFEVLLIKFNLFQMVLYRCQNTPTGTYFTLSFANTKRFLTIPHSAASDGELGEGIENYVIIL